MGYHFVKQFTGLLWRVSRNEIPLFDTKDEKRVWEILKYFSRFLSVFGYSKNQHKYIMSQTLFLILVKKIVPFFSSCVSNKGISLRLRTHRTTANAFPKWDPFIWHTGWEKGEKIFILSWNILVITVCRKFCREVKLWTNILKG